MNKAVACRNQVMSQYTYYPMEQSLQYLNDIHPFEVDSVDTFKRRCDSIDVRRKRAFVCKEGGTGAMRVPGYQPPRPAAFVYDGRTVNMEKPQQPRVHVPKTGHYRGLGVPPRRCFRLREMKVLGNRIMPAYEFVSPDYNPVLRLEHFGVNDYIINDKNLDLLAKASRIF